MSLIVAIGAQNAFVLRQGLRGEYVLAVCVVCALSDMLLISVGIFFFDVIEYWLSNIGTIMRYLGGAFLLAYATKSAHSALCHEHVLNPENTAAKPLSTTLWVCLAITWLNPHVYLDTVFLMGSISTQYDGEKGLFAVGAMLASWVLFLSLGYGARFLRPLLSTPTSWRILDALTAVTMLAIALSLLF